MPLADLPGNICGIDAGKFKCADYCGAAEFAYRYTAGRADKSIRGGVTGKKGQGRVSARQVKSANAYIWHDQTNKRVGFKRCADLDSVKRCVVNGHH